MRKPQSLSENLSISASIDGMVWEVPYWSVIRVVYPALIKKALILLHVDGATILYKVRNILIYQIVYIFIIFIFILEKRNVKRKIPKVLVF